MTSMVMPAWIRARVAVATVALAAVPISVMRSAISLATSSVAAAAAGMFGVRSYRNGKRRCPKCGNLALKRVRDEMGLVNLKLMVPFCRTPEEGKKVIEVLREFGLVQGENGLEVYVMCEIPNNVIQIDAFAEVFDGFSIGSNDLTQLTLGVDRDSEIVGRWSARPIRGRSQDPDHEGA